MVMIVRPARIHGQDVQFLEYPALHLVRSLVSECYGKNMPVSISVIAFQKKRYIFSCKPVCLSRARRSLHYLKHTFNPLNVHRPHIILKSQ